MADIVARVGEIESWRKNWVDPNLEKVDDIEVRNAGIDAKMNLIAAIGVATLTLVVGLVIAIFTWGLNQIHVKIEPPSQSSQLNATIPTLTR